MKSHREISRTLLLTLACGYGVSLACVTRVLAQDVAPAAQAPAPEATPQTTPAASPVQFNAPDNPLLDASAAASMARVALLDLRGIDHPTRDDFSLCEKLLARAQALAPTNAEIIRRRVEAAHAAGDNDALAQATADLVRVDPSDTVAQLRLITARLAVIQTAGDRLAAYAKLLGTDGQRIDPSIRSRLALDAALLARETGNEALFVERLKQATSLDGTNKDAAVLALSYFTQHVQDPKESFRLLVNLLYADPMDVGVLMQLRDELASVGAGEGAMRFQRIAAEILSSQGDIGLEQRIATMALEWRANGPTPVHANLVKQLDMSRDAQAQLFERATRVIVSVDVRKPEDIRLAPLADQMRASAALTLGDVVGLRNAVADLRATLEEGTAVLRDATRRPAEMEEADALRRATDMDCEVALWQLFTGEDLEGTKARTQPLIDSLPEEDPLRGVLGAWLKLRSGDLDGALVLAGSDADALPWLGAARASALIEKGDKAQASLVLRRVVEAEPLTPLGCWAWSKAKQLDPGYINPNAADLERIAKEVPTWLDQMHARPGMHQRLLIEVPKDERTTAQSATMTVKLRNTSPIPLALGAAKPLDSRLLFAPGMDLGSRSWLTKYVVGEVVMLDRRLRIMPNEEVTFSVEPELAGVGWVLGTASVNPVKVRYRVLQGFITTPDGGRLAGPGCLDVSCQPMVRAALPQSRLQVDSLAALVEKADEYTVGSLALASRALLLQSKHADTGEIVDASPVARAWAKAYSNLSPQARIIALCELPVTAEDDVMEAFDAAAQAETDPKVLPFVLLTRVASVDAPLLASLETSADEFLAHCAMLQKERITRDATIFSTAGITGLRAATPAAPSPTTTP